MSGTNLALRDRLFFRAAAEGAQLRAAASAVGAGELARLGLPRSVVLLASDIRARLAAEAAVALATDARAPIVVTGELPHYIGALDLVIVLCDDPGDRLSVALAEAARRGADTVLLDPGEGPVRAAVDRDTILLHRPAMSDGGSYCGYLGAIFSVLTEAGVTSLGPIGVLNDVADAVDNDMMACAIDRDLTVNPARQSAAWLQRRSVVCTGMGDVWRSVAELSAACLLEAGVVAHGTARVDFMRSLPALTQAHSNASEDIFYDPEFDEPKTGVEMLPLGAFVVAAPAELHTVQELFGYVDWARIECPAKDVETRHPLVDVCVTAARVAAVAAFVTEVED